MIGSCGKCDRRPWECLCSKRRRTRFDTHADGSDFPALERYEMAHRPYYLDNTPGT